ncbi:hypothetical protein HYPDE_26438 [Hyphomicrobium denitrificans 1NES1]|uniref:Uncharacterized protein n=1 Tax=Hyphomicrobium denitrificans 1NES1 TaxID=670307 RepID=N0B201_9HYPH|nr:hypothetical protein HYPDE_26438 [Hyphomicrobium denitrificans 1NES1]
MPNFAGSRPMLAIHSSTKRVLPRCKPASVATTSDEELARLASGQAQILVDGLACLIGQLKPYRPAGFLLPDGCAVHRVSTRRNIIDADGNYVTAAKLAVDR